MSGLVFPESPRWHDHHLWFSDWGAHEVIALDLDGKSEVIARVPSFPMCIDRLPDGRLLIVSASDGLLLCREPDGSLATYADLTDLADHKWNDVVVDGRGNARRPTLVALVRRRRRARSSPRREPIGSSSSPVVTGSGPGSPSAITATMK